jgi:hypothetical protein
MESKHAIIWYDREGDFLEVLFEKKEGYFRATDDDRVMEKVDVDGHVLGFSVLGVSQISGRPLELAELHK